jgi:hypothetical protein
VAAAATTGVVGIAKPQTVACPNHRFFFVVFFFFSDGASRGYANSFSLFLLFCVTTIVVAPDSMIDATTAVRVEGTMIAPSSLIVPE